MEHSDLNTGNTVGCAVLNRNIDDWGSFTYLLQLVIPMTEEILLGISHLLLTVKAKHAGHQCRHGMLPLVTSGCTVNCKTFTQALTPCPATTGLGGTHASSNSIGRSNWSSIRSTFALISLIPKCLSGIGYFGPESTPNVGHSWTIKQLLNMEYHGSFTCPTPFHGNG